MNELFTDFKKQFEKLQASKEGSTNYEVGIMYDKYYVRKKEIAENVLMIAICDVEEDGMGEGEEKLPETIKSTFNIGQVDLLFGDFAQNFEKLQETIDNISHQIN